MPKVGAISITEAVTSLHSKALIMLWMMAQKNFRSFFLCVLLQPIQIIASGQSTDAQLLTFNSHLCIGIIQNCNIVVYEESLIFSGKIPFMVSDRHEHRGQLAYISEKR